VADAYAFSALEQHVLARRLTAIMSGGIVASFAAGWVMDQREVGPRGCALITVALGQLQLFVLVLKGGSSSAWLTLSFVLYGFFRQFLFPAFIANLTDKLGTRPGLLLTLAVSDEFQRARISHQRYLIDPLAGFRYFGSLNGLAFAASGVSQLFMSSLISAVQGTCHLAPPVGDTAGPVVAGSTSPCSRGHWTALHVAEMLALGAILLAPYWERLVRIRKSRIRRPDKSSLLLSLHPLPVTSSLPDEPAELSNRSGLYGSVSTHEDGERGDGF
jgi:hypothetical protein